MPTTFRSDPNISTFRKIAAAMWGRANDPTIYGSVDVDAGPILTAIERLRADGQKVTVTHFVARAVALMFRKYPEVNAKVRFWGKVELRDSIDLFLQVSMDDGKDLSGVRVENADTKTVVELSKEIADKARKIREKSDPTYEKSRGLFGWLPWFLIRPILRLSDFLANELHLHMPGWGMPRDPFGTAMITNVGMFGVDTAFAPLTPIARCPLIVLVTEVRDRPWVAEKKVEVRPVLRLCATFDHRIVDGAYAGRMARELLRLLAEPLKLAEAGADTPTLKAATPPAAGAAPAPGPDTPTKKVATSPDSRPG